MWLIAIIACCPFVVAVVVRLHVARVWKGAAKELGGRYTKPRFADAFICRDFHIDGTCRKASVRMKTVEEHIPDDANLSGGLLGMIWDLLFASRRAYGVQIIVTPEQGVIPTNLTIRPKIRQSTRVNPKLWSDQVLMRGQSPNLLPMQGRLAVQRAVVQHGAVIVGGAVVLTRTGPLFAFENCKKVIEDMAKAAEALTMSFNAWSGAMEAAPDTPATGVAPVHVGASRVRSDP